MAQLTHINDRGEAEMVDVSEKMSTRRVAQAEGRIEMQPHTLALIRSGVAKKGDAIATARIAGIMAAKRTHELIPLCHQLSLSKVNVDFHELEADTATGLRAIATARVIGQTGVEMEALTAVSIACLTLYDMLKATDRSMVISGIRLLAKSGGSSGTFAADQPVLKD
ncbi:MAG: cyclic pyranopterin monophosphate synthase MoaC [Hyphomicrobiaceae bacterium]